ncbi:hypothetical protein AJ79_06883 [Helicocarpus griseus UAMH5409]|uniref:Uncharacterized protein n=1 Tax=Helicocarpus griseus UAMH5409 TaxID=1447875 RepID=A0A2B7X844_9EURO|nr:hypothetical protein AJ79_06883 [Helicocarpus griseus UAMH5409]
MATRHTSPADPMPVADLHRLPKDCMPESATRNNGFDDLASSLERFELRALAEGWPAYRSGRVSYLDFIKAVPGHHGSFRVHHALHSSPTSILSHTCRDEDESHHYAALRRRRLRV